MECPICYDTLTQVNCITTSCGHAFHANCLMKHTAHNGYTCPCCREQMIEEPDEDNESEDEDSLFDDEDDYFYEDTITSEEREEEALQSFRWFQQRLAPRGQWPALYLQVLSMELERMRNSTSPMMFPFPPTASCW